MRLRRARAVVFAGQLLAAWLLAGLPAMANAESGEKEAQLHFKLGRRYYDVGRFEDAASEFKKAYALSGSAPLLFNVAQAYRSADQPEEAIRFYRRYLERAEHPANEAEVRQKIADLQVIIEHRAEVERFRKREPVPAPAPAPMVTPNPPATIVPVTPAEPSRPANLRKVSYVLIGGGVATLATAGVLGLVARSYQSRVESAAAGGRFDSAADSTGHRLNTATVVTAISGGVLIAVGATVWRLSREGTSAQRATAIVLPVLSPGSAGVMVEF